MPTRTAVRRAVARLVPGAAAVRRRWVQLNSSVTDTQRRVADLQGAVEALQRDVHSAGLAGDGRLEGLRRMVGEVENYQPLYGITGIIDAPARTSVDRARAIEAAMGGVRGKRLLDIGSSLGYMTFYFADRGAIATGWEYNAANAEVARQVESITGVRATFVVKELTLESVRTIEPGAYDCALVLAVFHHVIHFQGLDDAQEILAELLARIPVVFLELAARGEDPTLFWDAAQPEDPLDLLAKVRDDVQVTRLGMFDTHLSDHRRPLYKVARPTTVRVGEHDYAYDTVSREAYRNSPASGGPWSRRYYYSPTHVVKEYEFATEATDNWKQIIGELYVHTVLSAGHEVHHALVVDDVHLDHDRALIAVRRVAGNLLSDAAPLPDRQLHAVVRDVLMTLADLRDVGFHHNDVRSWNIVVAPDGGWLIDYGRAAHHAIEDDAVALAWAAVAGKSGGREPADESKVDLPDLRALRGTPLAGFAEALLRGERDLRALLAEL